MLIVMIHIFWLQ